MLSKLTMIGLHEYSDGSIWSNLVLPEGIDKDLFINECLRQGGEFPVLYPDLEFFKMQIGVFSQKWFKNFERWYKAYQFEYEALFNLDVTSTITEEGTNKEKNTESSNGSMNHNDSENHSENHSDNTGASGTNTTSKAAFDSSSLQVTEQTSTSGSTNSSGGSSGSSTSSGIQTSNGSKSGTSDSEHKIVTTEVRQGNQGVTMSQEMLLAEYNAWSFNLYHHMAEIFISEFCICIYV